MDDDDFETIIVNAANDPVMSDPWSRREPFTVLVSDLEFENGSRTVTNTTSDQSARAD